MSLRSIQGHRPGRIAALRVTGVRATRTLWLVCGTARSRAPAHAAFIALAVHAQKGARLD